MCKMVCALLVLFVTVVAGFPGRELMFDLGSDTAVVESTVRETRAVSPENIEDLLQPGLGDDGTKKASKRSYQVSEELRQDDEKHRKPLEEYEVDDGYGDSEGYIDGESENYEEGDGDSEHYEEGAGEGGSNPYTEYDGEEQYAPLKSSSYIVSGGAGGGNAEDYESEGYNADDYDD